VVIGLVGLALISFYTEGGISQCKNSKVTVTCNARKITNYFKCFKYRLVFYMCPEI